MADTKYVVSEDAFKAALRALLNAKPEPMAEIPRKRAPGAKNPGPKRARKTS